MTTKQRNLILTTNPKYNKNASTMLFVIAKTSVDQTIVLQKLAVLNLKKCFHLKIFSLPAKSHYNGHVGTLKICVRILYFSSIDEKKAWCIDTAPHPLSSSLH